MRNKSTGIGILAVCATVWATAANVGGAGQGGTGQPGAQPAPQRISITTTQIKPDMLVTWQDIIRNETIPALKKAGVPWRWVWANTPVGGPGFTYVTVTPVTNYAQFDQPSPLEKVLGADGLARYNAKIRPAIVSTHTEIHTMVQQASIQSFSGKPPALATVQTIQVLPGRGQEWAAITASDVLPALKKAGVTDYWVSTTTFGGPQQRRTIVTAIANFAQLDAGPLLNRALGAEAAQKINEKRNALTTGPSEITVMRFVPDLSFGAPSRPTS